jgi:biofilm PGA synthesis N-glycosyltransferase PgaC
MNICPSSPPMACDSYVIVTPARNEAAHISKTIHSVVSQTILPARWVIVSDGSTDGTDAIVEESAAQHSFIDFVRFGGYGCRSLGSQIAAFKAGCDEVQGIPFRYIGKLDADLSFEPDYFHDLIEKFRNDPRLGIGGGSIHEEKSGVFERSFGDIERCVPGAVQFFRKECFDEVGGLLELKHGGADTIAEVMARMKGWRCQSFPELPVRHHRPQGTAGRGPLLALVHAGVKNHAMGYHPVYQFAKCLARARMQPVVLSGILIGVGYALGALRREDRGIPNDVVTSLRKEQIGRLRAMLRFGRCTSCSSRG